MAYHVYLGRLALPVTPSKITTKINNKNKTVTLINEGEVNLLKTPGLTEINFEFMVPQVQHPFADRLRPASYYLGQLEKLKVKKQVFQFIVSRVSPAGKSLFRTNLKVALEEYQIIEDAKEGQDLIISVKLKQYRAYGTKTVTVKAATPTTATTVASTTPREGTKETPKTVTVVSGDSLWKICQQNLGDGSKYSSIAALNGISNPNLIYPGQVIKLE